MQRRRNTSGKTAIVWALEHSEKDSQEFTQPVPTTRNHWPLYEQTQGLLRECIWP